jgi:hypothetical protein
VPCTIKRRIVIVSYERRTRPTSYEQTENLTPESSSLARFFEVCDNPSAWAGNNAGDRGIQALADTLRIVRGETEYAVSQEELEEAEVLLERYRCDSASDPEDILQQRVMLTRVILPVLVADTRVTLATESRIAIIESFYDRLYDAWQGLEAGPEVSPAEVRRDMASQLTPHLEAYDLTDAQQSAGYRQARDAMRKTNLISPLAGLRWRHA